MNRGNITSALPCTTVRNRNELASLMEVKAWREGKGGFDAAEEAIDDAFQQWVTLLYLGDGLPRPSYRCGDRDSYSMIERKSQ